MIKPGKGKILVISLLVALSGAWNSGLMVTSVQAAFNDLSQNHPQFQVINYLQEQQIVQGYPDGNFYPERSVIRIELLKVLLESGGFSLDAGSDARFADVLPDVWFAPYVAKARALGWVHGYEDGLFRPQQTVSKVEAVKLLLKSLDLHVAAVADAAPYADVSVDVWYAPYLRLLQLREVISGAIGLNFWPDKEITRGTLAGWQFKLIALLKLGEDKYRDELGMVLAEGRVDEYLLAKAAEEAAAAAAAAAAAQPPESAVVITPVETLVPVVPALPVITPLTPQHLAVSYEDRSLYTNDKIPQADMIVLIFKVAIAEDQLEPAQQSVIIDQISLKVRGSADTSDLRLFTYEGNGQGKELVAASGFHAGSLLKDSRFTFDLRALDQQQRKITEANFKLFMVKAHVRAVRFQELSFWFDKLGDLNSSNDNPGDIIWTSEGVRQYWLAGKPNHIGLPKLYFNFSGGFVNLK